MPFKLPRDIEKDIATDDPLLLRPATQKDFANSLLMNLLLFRGGMSFQPVVADLFADASSVSAEAAAARVSFQALAEDRKHVLVEAVATAKANRSSLKKAGVTENELRLLRRITMLSYGELTSERGSETIPEQGAQPQKSDTLRIAAIGYRVPVSLLEDECLFSEVLRPLHLMASPLQQQGETFDLSRAGRIRHVLTPAQLETWRTQIQSRLSVALSSGAHIAFLPEFALPPDGDAPDAAFKVISELCAAHDGPFLVFSGTRHDGVHNLGLVASKTADPAALVGGPRWHYKISSARSYGENILGPGDTTFPCYPLDMPAPTAADDSDAIRQFLISLPVCVDAFDPTVFLALISDPVENYTAERFNIVLVPSFNPSPDFVALLRDLSFLKRCSVVYLDALHGESRHFICGFDLAEFLPGDAARRTSGRLETWRDDLVTQLASLAQRERDLKNELLNLADRASSLIDTKGRVETIRRQLVALRGFEEVLKDLEDDDLLPRLSCSPCVTCREGHGAAPHDCMRDVLYYDLPLDFIEAVWEFRETYFIEADFLPEALWHASFVELRQMLRSKSSPPSRAD